MNASAHSRVAAYVDGFNLYYGLNAAGWRRYLWLDLNALCTSLLRPGQELIHVTYFTARVDASTSEGGAKGQNTYLEALHTLPSLDIKEGHFVRKDRKCRDCGATIPSFEEKMTDVNISVALLTEAQDDVFDVAFVVSGDSDLLGPIQEVRRRYPAKSVVVAFPPKRVSLVLRSAGPSFVIGQKKIRQSQFPERVQTKSGVILTKPSGWR